MGVSWEEAEFLVQVVRDASLGGSFGERFNALSENLLTLVPGVALSAMVIAPESEQPLLHSYFRNRDPGKLRDYVKHYRQFDPMGPTIEKAQGTPILLSDFVDERAWGKDAFTGELLPQDRVRHIMGLSVPLSEGQTLALTIQRSNRQEDFSLHERRLVHLLAPELGRAALGLLLRERVAELRASGELSPDPRAGGLLFDERGWLLHSDSGAQSLLERFAEQLPLELLAGDAQRLCSAGVTACALERLVPLPGREGALQVVSTKLEPSASSEVAVLTVLERIEPPEADAFEVVAERAKLTPREREVARLAVEGHGNQGIAYELGISRVTVGVHLSKVYRKTGANGRVELATLMTRLGGQP